MPVGKDIFTQCGDEPVDGVPVRPVFSSDLPALVAQIMDASAEAQRYSGLYCLEVCDLSIASEDFRDAVELSLFGRHI